MTPPLSQDAPNAAPQIETSRQAASDPTAQAMSPTEWALLVLLSLLWGGSFFFVGVAVHEVPTLSLVAARVGIAAVLLWAIAVAFGARVPRDRRVWIAFFGMGLLNNVAPFCLIVWGQQFVASGVASILNATTPIFAMTLAHLLTDDRMTPGKLVGVALGVAGVATLMGGDAVRALWAESGDAGLWGQAAILGAALSYGFASVFGARFRRLQIPPLVGAAGQTTASTLLLAPMALWLERPFAAATPSAEALAAVLALAVLSTALAYAVFFRILATAGGGNVMLVTLLVPVSAIALGVAFLDEAIALRHLGGMALIAIGLLAIDGRALAWARRKTRRGDGGRGDAGPGGARPGGV